MNEQNGRLRHLLRDADPARDAPELVTAEAARLRRTVLGALEREPRAWPSRPAIAWALAAALAAAVTGLALWRFDATRKAAPREDRAATSVPMRTPKTRHDGPPPAAREASRASEGTAIAATTTSGRPSLPTTAATPARAEVAAVPRHRAHEGPRTGPRSSPPAIQSPAPPGETAPTETLAAAQPASEPRQPYQLQLTAPGGTRIVWLLTSSSGR